MNLSNKNLLIALVLASWSITLATLAQEPAKADRHSTALHLAVDWEIQDFRNSNTKKQDQLSKTFELDDTPLGDRYQTILEELDELDLLIKADNRANALGVTGVPYVRDRMHQSKTYLHLYWRNNDENSVEEARERYSASQRNKGIPVNVRTGNRVDLMDMVSFVNRSNRKQAFLDALEKYLYPMGVEPEGVYTIDLGHLTVGTKTPKNTNPYYYFYGLLAFASKNIGLNFQQEPFLSGYGIDRNGLYIERYVVKDFQRSGKDQIAYTILLGNREGANKLRYYLYR